MIFFFLSLFLSSLLVAQVEVGVDRFFKEGHEKKLHGKRVGLVTNHTAMGENHRHTIDAFCQSSRLVALFAPEHGINGLCYAAEEVLEKNHDSGIPIFSLHGKTRRPTESMLKTIDVLVYDIQDIGVRSYTFASTLFYLMEEAAKFHIPVIVLDRPNPINGLIVDGPMMEETWRSFVGYINVPYCHGMTIGELASFFNEEYHINCALTVIPMKGWKRKMSFKDTGLTWVPLSPAIPEPTTPLYYASTGILGELGHINIGVGYTLPFKVVGAEWIDAKVFAEKLNVQHLPGVHFTPFHYRPFYGSFKGKECHGVMIVVTNEEIYRPLSVQYLIMGILSSLYPEKMKAQLDQFGKNKEKFFCQVNGSSTILKILREEKYSAWKLIQFQKEEREKFLKIREKYLIPDYN